MRQHAASLGPAVIAQRRPAPAARAPRRGPTHAASAFAVATGFLLALWGLAAPGWLPRSVPWAYSGLSLVTLLAYARDKRAATRDDWRTPESTLHLLALLGGWPGALWARQLLRHKSSKKSFTRVFHLTIAINLGLLAWLALPPGRQWLAQLAALLP